MPRAARQTPGGLVYHVLNRGVGRMTLFDDDEDYGAFERALAQTLEAISGVRLLGYCLMPNHWHLVVRPVGDDNLSRFMQRLTTRHVRRWLAHRHEIGTGPVYQGRFKSFPIQTDEHLLTVLRYVERNALRAGLVETAEDWRWGSLWRWANRRLASTQGAEAPALSPWPVERPRRWAALVNDALTEAELAALRTSANRGRPYGGERWAARIKKRLGLESAYRSRGRPRKTVRTTK